MTWILSIYNNISLATLFPRISKHCSSYLHNLRTTLLLLVLFKILLLRSISLTSRTPQHRLQAPATYDGQPHSAVYSTAKLQFISNFCINYHKRTTRFQRSEIITAPFKVVNPIENLAWFVPEQVCSLFTRQALACFNSSLVRRRDDRASVFEEL